MNKELKYTVPAGSAQEFTYPTGVARIAITNHNGTEGGSGESAVVTKTIENVAVANFVDAAAAALVDLIVDITAVQEGSGNPSPTNIRPITGWTAANVYVSDEDTSNPTTYNINWQSAAGTVYGGTLNVLTGELIVTDKLSIIDENSNIAKASTTDNIFYIGKFFEVDYGIDSTLSNVYTRGISRDTLVSINEENPDFSFCGFTGSSGSGTPGTRLVIKDSRFSSTSDYKTWLSNNPVQIVQKLAAPIIYHLTPVEIYALLGENNVWANCGNIAKLTYIIYKYEPLLEEIEEAKVKVFKATDNGGGVYTLDDITCDELCLYARTHSNIVLKVARYNSAIAYDIFILSDYIGTSAVFRHTMITSAIGGGYVLYVRELQADSGTATNVLTTRDINITADT